MVRKYKAVEIISDMLRESADSVLQKLREAMNDDRLSADEREQVRKALERYPTEIEARVRWWKTGEGPPP